MSLLECFGDEYVIMEKHRVPDGEGGHITAWKESEKFVSFREYDNSLQARIAEKEGMVSTYTFLVKEDTPVVYHDFVRNVKTGDTFYVTSNPEDIVAPKSSTFGLKCFTAEKRALP